MQLRPVTPALALLAATPFAGAAAKGLDGPQPAELARMLGEAKERLAADEGWVATRRAALQAADRRLNAAFTALLPRDPAAAQ